MKFPVLICLIDDSGGKEDYFVEFGGRFYSLITRNSYSIKLSKGKSYMSPFCKFFLTKFNIQLRIRCNRCNKIKSTKHHDTDELRKQTANAIDSRQAIISVQEYWVDE